MADPLTEKFGIALPPHLSEADKKKLLDQLRDFPSLTNFYSIVEDAEPVQGDAWRGLTTIDFYTRETQQVIGFVISNSCDIAQANQPSPNQRVLFAPLLDLDLYAEDLRREGISDGALQQRLSQIRAQELHRIFYLPPSQKVPGESIVLLDDIQAQPLDTVNFHEMERVFSLSTYGFYVFLFKLSVHFMRLTDGVPREPVPA